MEIKKNSSIYGNTLNVVIFKLNTRPTRRYGNDPRRVWIRYLLLRKLWAEKKIEMNDWHISKRNLRDWENTIELSCFASQAALHDLFCSNYKRYNSIYYKDLGRSLVCFDVSTATLWFWGLTCSSKVSTFLAHNAAGQCEDNSLSIFSCKCA